MAVARDGLPCHRLGTRLQGIVKGRAGLAEAGRQDLVVDGVDEEADALVDAPGGLGGAADVDADGDAAAAGGLDRATDGLEDGGVLHLAGPGVGGG